MDKTLCILFFIIKILVIIVFPILLFIFRNKIAKSYIYTEIVFIVIISVLYLIGFPYMVDSNLSNISNIKLLNNSNESILSNYIDELNSAEIVKSMEPDDTYRTHRNDKVYYYNGFEKSLSIKKIKCDNDYDYLKYYSDIIVSTSSLLSSYFNKKIDPIEVYNKAYTHGLVKCGEPINKDNFFYMIYQEYKVNFTLIKPEELENYILNGKIVLLESKGNGFLSCNQSYFLVYNIDNNGKYLLLDPNNKSYSYICPDDSTGFGNILKPNYNELSFDRSSLLMDTSRLIVIGGTR